MSWQDDVHLSGAAAAWNASSQTPCDRFQAWFEENGGVVDHAVVELADLPGQGRGVVARTDIPEGHTLFTIPRDLVLSTQTSKLPSLLGEEKWKKRKLDKGWAGLILCMMWEYAQGTASRWSGYLAFLPQEFHTLMFWTDADLEELRGSSVLDKIGKADAEKGYYEKILPAILSCPHLFPEKQHASYYSIKQYHVMGSNILSRNFNLGDCERRQEGSDADQDASTDDAMDLDVVPAAADPSRTARTRARIEDDDDDDDVMDSDDSDDDGPSDVVMMVPMADMLNARNARGNARLFRGPNALKMVTTRHIPAGEKICETYDDLPSSELLRRYGYVDLHPLPRGLGESSPSDAVEIRADLVVDVVSRTTQTSVQSYKEHIDWYLEEGGDDIFVLDVYTDVPDDMRCLIRLLMLPDEWARARDEYIHPEPNLDRTVLLRIAQEVLQSRLAMYATSMAEDEELLKASETLSRNKRHAIIIRLGEKRILNGTLKKVKRKLQDRTNEYTRRRIDAMRPDHPGKETSVVGKKRKRQGREPGELFF